MRRQPTMLRLVATILIASHLVACTSWRRQSLSPTDLFAQRSPSEIRVTSREQVQIVLRLPFIKQDSLIGWLSSSNRATIPLHDVASIATREPDPDKTIYLVVGIIGGLGLAFYGLVQAALAADDS